MSNTESAITRTPKNIVLFGETGVGKSSVINLLAGETLAKTSRSLEGCTLESTEYQLNLSEEVALRIFDTVGLEEPDIGINTFMGAIVKAHKLITSLHSTGGIDLLLFCIRGGRLTRATQRTYRLFSEILCGNQVPLAIVVTNLEQENTMEDWWVNNERTFNQYGIRPVAHACITAVPAHVTLHARKRRESREILRKMLLSTLRNSKPHTQDTQGWFVLVLRRLRVFLPKKGPLKYRDLVEILETRCGYSYDDARALAQILKGRDPGQVGTAA